eukprot:767594-Hanusia_phi.AAC.15
MAQALLKRAEFRGGGGTFLVAHQGAQGVWEERGRGARGGDTSLRGHLRNLLMVIGVEIQALRYVRNGEE